jgi:hypothetical protein
VTLGDSWVWGNGDLLKLRIRSRAAFICIPDAREGEVLAC